MQKPLALCICNIGKLPLAGFSLADLHIIDGLQALGYDVHYVERMNEPQECYDPRSNTMTDDPSYALSYIGSLLPRFGISPERYSFIDRDNNCHGSGWQGLQNAIGRADFVLAMGDPTWFDELEDCPRRAFIDTDPLFTQVAMETGVGRPASTQAALSHYNVLFTEGMRYGKEGCTIPSGGRDWIPIPPVISTRLWKPTSARSNAPITTVMNWESGGVVNWANQEYGYKDRELSRFFELPQKSARLFEIALGGSSAPRKSLRKYGWSLVDPLSVTGTIEAYQRFIADSWADFGIAKHAYVQSQGGWFSDRSTCYMASGRPVLHQDTGCGDWLPTGEGVLLFSNIDDVKRGLEEFEKNYDHHARMARLLAEEYFEAEKILHQMIGSAEFH